MNRTKTFKAIVKFIKGFLIFYVVIMVIGYFLQERLIFQPENLPQNFKYSFNFPFEEINLKTNDNESINALHIRADNTKGVILYFHGNSGSLRRWGDVTSYFIDYNYDVFVMDFRGFGKSTGAYSEEAMYADAQQCYDYLKKKYDEDKIVVYGKSLGTTFATKIAARNKPQQLILEVPFYNLGAAGKHRFPFVPIFLLKYKFMTNEYIKQVVSPITFFHGTNDWITPYKDSRKLFEEVKLKDKTFITIEGGNHNNLIQYEKYHRKLKELLK